MKEEDRGTKEARGRGVAKTGRDRWLKGCEAVAGEAEEAQAVGVVGSRKEQEVALWSGAGTPGRACR